jgi:hypothetical protein
MFKRGSDHGEKTLLFVTGMGNGTAVKLLKSSEPLIGTTACPREVSTAYIEED